MKKLKPLYKIILGFIIVPLGILLSIWWPMWEQTTKRRRWLAAPVVVPLAILMTFLAPWWEKL